MIQLSHNYTLPEKAAEEMPVKIVGVGGAGSNLLDRMVLDGLDKADLIAVNTDVQSLASAVAAQKVQLGRTVTRGLGAGGDPELGYNAAYESADEIRQVLVEARMIFVCAGLGGGTGSGAAPAVAQVARESGALVIALATMPFAFEGKRRMAQAREALARLREHADAVVCFENDRMGDMVAPKAGIHQAFAAADSTISQSVRSMVNLMQRPGLIRIGFDDLLSALRSPGGQCLFGFGESDSGNRAHDALTSALKNPLMDRGRMLADASHVLVHIAGGPAMTLTEVEIVMKELGRHIRDHTQILFGTSIDGRMGNRLSVTLISSLATDEKAESALDSAPVAVKPAKKVQEKLEPIAPPMPPIWEAAAAPMFAIAPESPAQIVEASSSMEHLVPLEEPRLETAETPPVEFFAAPAVEEAPPPPRVILPRKKPVPFAEPKPAEEKKMHAKQEVLQFEPVTRGRFEKSEPTIVEGQDLDVPTFLRKNIRVK